MKNNSLTTITTENDLLSVTVAPEVGGKVVSIVYKPAQKEILWRNAHIPLRLVPAGTPYDPEFYGGIDEQIPCDGPEVIHGIEFDDHGEPWTTPFSGFVQGNTIRMEALLPKLQFRYEKSLNLQSSSEDDCGKLLVVHRMTNCGQEKQSFLWKAHIALEIEKGDTIECTARYARPLAVEFSRCSANESFRWPFYHNLDMSEIPEKDGSSEFLVLSDLREGSIGLNRQKSKMHISVHFDTSILPYCWLFASYGKLDGHYTVVLEPSTSDTTSVNTQDNPNYLLPGESFEVALMYQITANL